MPETVLRELLERNGRHSDSLPENHFATVLENQDPAAVSICCSDSRVSQEGMFDVREPGWLFTPSTIGNQVWDRVDGEFVVDGSVLYPLTMSGTSLATVVGHTGCGAVTAALDVVRGETDELPSGISKWVELLVPVVEDGLDASTVDPEADVSLVNQLVEYNVDRQVEMLCESDEVPDGVTVYGFVYDFQNVYGETPGRTYLVNADGERDETVLADLVPDEFEQFVRRLQ